jgi:hypothetical protein
MLPYKPINLQASDLYAVMNNSEDISRRRTGQKTYEKQTAVFLLPIWTRLLTETHTGVFQMPHRHIGGVSVAANKTLPWKYSQIMQFPQMSAQRR